jgi:L-ascorbate metabolism protein UlaG (beta-lactamase superfamily)
MGGIILSLMPCSTNAQEKNTIEKSAFWGNSEAYLNKQAFRMFDLIDLALTENPPTIGSSMVRKLALYNLDVMLHETKYDNSEPFYSFLFSRINKVITDLSEPVNEGIKIYKVYNDGFIARTGSVTIAFDIVRGICNGKTLIPDSLVRQIVDYCDVLFITHNHNDHADPVVAEMFIKAGKPVVGPTNLWEDNKNILHLRSEKVINKQLKLGKNQKTHQVRIFPGNQDELMNNIYVVTTEEKKTIVHIGDQYNKEDMTWITNIKKEIPQPDVLVVNCWTYEMNGLVEGFNPKLVITGHENEMGHTIDHREAFWLSFQKMEQINKDYLVMGWGEWFHVPAVAGRSPSSPD